MQTTTIKQDTLHSKSEPLPVAQLQQSLREIFDSRKSWMLVFDDVAKGFVDGLAIGYGITGDGFRVFAVQLPGGTMMGIGAIEKAQLSAQRLAWQLRKIGVDLTVSEASERDLLILASPPNLDTATALMDLLLSHGRAPNCPTVPMSSMRTVDAQTPFGWESRN